MKIALAQINVHVGHFEHNVSRMLQALEESKRLGAALVIFPELSVCGYPPGDLLDRKDFIGRCLEAVNQVAAHCHGVAAIVGSPSWNRRKAGKSLYNSAFFLEEGGIAQVVHKALLPNYDIFDEYRYFEPASSFRTMAFGGRRLALTICEDLWNVDERPMYPITPMDELMRESPDVIINVAASPFAWNHDATRLRTLSRNASRYGLPLFFSNQLGGQTELLFDGGSAVLDRSGLVAARLPFFREALEVFNLEDFIAGRTENHAKFAGESPSLAGATESPAEASESPSQPAGPPAGQSQGTEPSPGASPGLENFPDAIGLIHQALVMGLGDYFRKTGMKRAILGLSGGLDSALVAALAVEALGADHVWGVLLPGPYSSDHSVSDALDLAGRLGIKTDIIPIQHTMDALQQGLQSCTGESPGGITEENLQARARAVLLMGLSNQQGHMLLNTSNKSEAAVGYTTLYGDMCGGLSVIGDVYKTQAYALARHLNMERELIPENILTKAPSAELRPDQLDTDSLPPYEVLDPILFEYIENKRDASAIQALGHDADTVGRVIALVDGSEYKRKQAPPVLRVSPKAFGKGRRMPLEARYPRP